MKSFAFKTTLPDGRIQNYTYYNFNKGEGIPLHSHDHWHSSCCFGGSYEVFDDTGKTIILDAGKFVEFQKQRQHGILALEDNTSLIHVNEPE